MNILRRGFQKLSCDRQTDRHDRNYTRCRFAGGQKQSKTIRKLSAVQVSNLIAMLAVKYSETVTSEHAVDNRQRRLFYNT